MPRKGKTQNSLSKGLGAHNSSPPSSDLFDSLTHSKSEQSSEDFEFKHKKAETTFDKLFSAQPKLTLRTAPSPPARLHLTVNSSNSDLFLSAAQNSDQSLNANEFFSTSRQTTSSTNRGDEDEDEDSAQLYKSITKPASPPGVAKGKENKLGGAKAKGKGKGKGKKEKDTGATQKCLAPPSPPKTRGRVFSDETLNYELQKLGVAPKKNAAAAPATPSPLPSTSDHFLSLSCNDGNALRSRRDSEILLARGSENIDIFESPICPEPQSRGVQMVTSTPMLPCPDVDERKKPPPSKGDAIKQDLKFCLEDVSEEGDDPEEHDPGEHAVKIVINGGSSDEKKRSTVRTTKKREEQEEPNREEEKEIVESSVLLVKGGKNWRRSIWTRKGRPSPNKASRKTIATLARTSEVAESAKSAQNRRTTHVQLDLGRSAVGGVVEASSFAHPSDAPAKNFVNLTRRKTGKAVGFAEPNSATFQVPNLSNSSNSRFSITPLKKLEDKAVVTPAGESFCKESSRVDNVSILLLDPSAMSTVDKVLSLCSRKEIVPFEELYSSEELLNSKKIGEGSYGEVYLLPAATESAPRNVLKVVPVDGAALVNGGEQTLLCDMLAEITISTELSRLYDSGDAPNFLQVVDCFLVQGFYPTGLLELWDAFDEERGSENDRPDSKLLDQDQKFISLVFGNGGRDLEVTQLSNASRGIAIFNQVVHALAVAENQLQFEHRDLHWGNILIRDTDEKVLSYSLDEDTVFEVKTEKIKATIIDFSLSRLTSTKDECVLYNDLSKDPELFQAKGDYQFDIYRMMRDYVNGSWGEFHPKTNIFWLHYLIDKLIGEVPYKSVKSAVHRSNMMKLRALKNKILEYSSAKEYVLENGTLKS